MGGADAAGTRNKRERKKYHQTWSQETLHNNTDHTLSVAPRDESTIKVINGFEVHSMIPKKDVALQRAAMNGTLWC